MSKPKGRLNRSPYRIMWDQNHQFQSHYNPPMAPETVAQAHFGFLAGTPVDAYVCALGPDAGYVTIFESQRTRMEFLVERYERGAALGDVRYWRHAENVKQLLAQGIDPLELMVRESHRLGLDHWFRLGMNDWHHFDADSEGAVYRLGGSQFYEGRRDLLIGPEGAAGWADHPALHHVLPWMQDFAHDEVRALRRDIALEVCERYDCAGFLFDFLRVPAFFRHGEERANAGLMTRMIRETREGLDEIARTRGRPVGLAVRLPPTIDGTVRMGLDVGEWIAEHLVDIVVTSPWFPQETEHDTAEWVRLGAASPVWGAAAIEEAYLAGHSDGFNRWFYNPPVMTPLSVEMIRALAARHHDRGVDGLYAFNWFATTLTFDYDNVSALDDIADPERLRQLDKRYMLMRSYAPFPNCLEVDRQIPVEIAEEPVMLRFDVVDDLTAAPELVRQVQLCLHVDSLTIADELEVRLNGREVPLLNPMEPGVMQGTVGGRYGTIWQIFDLRDHPPGRGENVVTVRARRRNQRTASAIPLTIEDAEIEIGYEHPTGAWSEPPGRRAGLFG